MAATKRIYVTARQEGALRRVVDTASNPCDVCRSEIAMLDDEDLSSLVALLSKLDVAKEHT